MLLCKLCVLNMIRKRGKKAELVSQLLLSLLLRWLKMFLLKREKKTLGREIYFCTKVILSLACVLCSPLPPFHFFCGLSYVVGGKKAYLTRQPAILHFFVFCYFLSKVREVVSFGTFKQLSPLLCHFQPVVIG